MLFGLRTHGWSKVSSFSTLKTVHVWHFTFSGNYRIKQNKMTSFKPINGWDHFSRIPIKREKDNVIPPLQRTKGEFSFGVEFCFWIIVSLSFTHQYIWLKSLQKETFKGKPFTSAQKNIVVRLLVTVVSRYKNRTQYNCKYL